MRSTQVIFAVFVAFLATTGTIVDAGNSGAEKMPHAPVTEVFLIKDDNFTAKVTMTFEKISDTSDSSNAYDFKQLDKANSGTEEEERMFVYLIPTLTTVTAAQKAPGILEKGFSKLRSFF